MAKGSNQPTRFSSEENLVEDESKSINLSTLFRYSTKVDKALIALGIICAIASGLMLPILSRVFGRLMDDFIKFSIASLNHSNGTTAPPDVTTISPNESTITPNFPTIVPGVSTSVSTLIEESVLYNSAKAAHADVDEFRKETFTSSGTVLALSVVYFFTITIYVWTLNKVAHRQSFRIRQKFMESIISLDIGYIEKTPSLSSGSIATTLLSNLVKIEDGIGESIGNVFNQTTAIIAQIVASLIINWKLTLALLAVFPFIIASMSIVQISATFYTGKQRQIKGKLGSICQESFSMIKTVAAFNGQKHEISRFNSASRSLSSTIIMNTFYFGIGMGLLLFLTNISYGIGVYIGTITIIDGSTVGDVLNVFWNIAFLSLILIILSPNIESIEQAKLGAKPIFDVIDYTTKNRYTSNTSIRMDQITNISVNSVTFAYPTRSDVPVLKNVTLNIEKGQTIALVGPSGSGKSSLLGILQKFYEISEGNIYINGRDIKLIDTNSLRDQISIVGQEPILFEGTIAENILLGKGANFSVNDYTMEEIIDASKRAHAHEFISKLPMRYKTKLTDSVKLSGGQKQRIAIARALIRESSLLLLDEATSALDSESGTLVNATMEEERRQNRDRITIIVAHKLDDIKTSDMIFVFKLGTLVECGKHDELLSKHGLYSEMYEAQKKMPQIKKEVAEDAESILNKSAMRRKSSVASFRRSVKRKYSKRKSYASSRMENSSNNMAEDIGGHDSAISENSISVESNGSFPWELLMRSKYCLFFGVIARIFTGFWIPFYAVLIGDFTSIMENDDDGKRDKAVKLGIGFAIAGLIVSISSIISGYFFGKVASNLTNEIRTTVYRSVIHKKIPWFESSNNGVGTLIFKIVSSIDAITDYMVDKFPGLVQNISTLVACTVIAFFHSWKLTLVVLVFIPVQFFLAFLEAKSSVSNVEDESKVSELEHMANLTIQIVDSIKTISSLNLQKHFMTKFNILAKSMYKSGVVPMKKRSFIIGGCKAGLPLISSVTFFVASHWISRGELKYDQFLKITEGILLACFVIAEDSIKSFGKRLYFDISTYFFDVNEYFFTDLSEVKSASRAVMSMVDKSKEIEEVTSGIELEKSIDGPISFTNVDFSYPSRPNAMIWKNFNLVINKGTKIAFTGESGCGKSTISTLILKYYNPTRGNIKLNGYDIRSIDDTHLRSMVSIVNQEPALFSCSILENITYGSYEDTNDYFVMDRVVNAAKMAQIHDAIMLLSNKYRTEVGDKGGQLSGGQKQRIAIARAFFRNPKILILDEATSALDALSKRLVEESIDKIAKDKIIISITHDKNSLDAYDKTYVMAGGKIVDVIEKKTGLLLE